MHRRHGGGSSSRRQQQEAADASAEGVEPQLYLALSEPHYRSTQTIRDLHETDTLLWQY